jgi:membrane protein
MSRLREIEFVGAWIASLSALAPYVLVIASFSFLYVFVPNTRVRFVPALIGGVFAGVLWAAGGSLFTTFVISVSRAEAIYSGFAIVIVAMAWLYLSWLILLLGAQLAFYVQNPDYLPLGPRTVGPSNALRERLALSAMLLIGRDFDNPGHGWRIDSLAARIRVPRHVLEPVVVSLVDSGLLTRTGEQRLIPARDPRRIAVAEIFGAVRSSGHDSHGTLGDDWNSTVNELADSVERAIREALGGRTLAERRRRFTERHCGIRVGECREGLARQPPPASVNPSTRTAPQRTVPRVSMSDPTAWISRNRSVRFPASVTSCTGYTISPRSTQNPAAPRE